MSVCSVSAIASGNTTNGSVSNAVRSMSAASEVPRPVKG